MDVQITRELFAVLEKEEEKEREEKKESIRVVHGYEKWEETQRACQAGRKVIALEITNQFSSSCARVRPLFERFAKEFPDVCVRVFTGPFPSFLTLDKVCHDVGQVKELPAILLLYYDEPNHILRKSYQGEVTIQSSLLNGQLKRKLKDFIDQRLQQMMKGSLKEPEIQYQHNLSRMSRSLSEDDMVQKRRSQDIGHETINIPSTVPESCEQVYSENDTDCNTGSSSIEQGPKSGKDTDDDVTSEPTPVKEAANRPPSANRLNTSHVIDRCDIEVGDQIGQGGFGTVFKAKWGNKKVAVKSCNGNLLEHGAAEVKILASLPNHPYVLKFFGVAVSEDKMSSLIVTELAFDGSLFAALHGKKREEPSDERRLRWASQVAEGMEYLHSKNIIHRDLKSPNVLLSRGVAIIGDFGTARELSKTCTPTGQAGTFRWMAPEIAAEVEHTKIDNKCDVFSYGMILYEIFALQLPFAEIENDIKVCWKIMHGERPPIPARAPSFLHPLIQDCWNSKPAARPPFEKIVTAIQTESYEEHDDPQE
jgi:hypothetical protein